ncbi:MAG: DegT/DnrJ/EryC1/StrS family aminotransferase [Saprospiraceae bacterium]|nr:DegT/DnrJ/EryC1/StrS family aminotransferase [Saprospiraceae bacterium]MBP7699031.1 DegT/DnrJ/EryC1/StrS family aminotransferase [Saprospiraceae bacterium]
MTTVPNIQMVDLKSQYLNIKAEIDQAVLHCIDSAQFIQGPPVQKFQKALETYLKVKHVIPCANGTDALQIAMMALDLRPGDEVILPAFTYIATAEVVALLGLTPVLVDVDYNTFLTDVAQIEKLITPKTRVIVPVHLYGQCVDMEPLMQLAQQYNIYVIEDNAQAIGADYSFSNGNTAKSGTIGHIGCTSFFPSKNLGCYGDGGAIFTNDDQLADKLRKIANHGQRVRYYHDYIGVNSRLDSIQAAILGVKLPHLNNYNLARQSVATYYDKVFEGLTQVQTPARQYNSTHVFHQYTLIVKDGKRDALQQFLQSNDIPTIIYYPVPLYRQKAFAPYFDTTFSLPITEQLCDEVISLPIHTEMEELTLQYIANKVCDFFNTK